MKKSTSAGGLVVNSKGKICLVWQPNSQTWAIPKGHIEEGETILETAKREIYEETGLKNIKKIRKLGIVKRPSRARRNVMKTIHFFLFKTDEDNLKPFKRWKHIAKWYSFDKAVKKDSFKQEKEFLLKNKSTIKG